MPGESAEAVQNKLDRYITEQGAETEAEKDALELSVLNYLRLLAEHHRWIDESKALWT
jgi:hypothetical protein